MEIKFRIWDRYRQAFLDTEKTWARIDFGDIYVQEDVEYDDINPSFQWKEIQQYIGQKDDDGKEIYVGDIILSKDEVYVVRWTRAYSGLQFCAVKMDGTLMDFYGGLPNKRKIIGNIFETPYLIEDKDDVDDNGVLAVPKRESKDG